MNGCINEQQNSTLAIALRAFYSERFIENAKEGKQTSSGLGCPGEDP
jgi:hypothetical protein